MSRTKLRSNRFQECHMSSSHLYSEHGYRSFYMIQIPGKSLLDRWFNNTEFCTFINNQSHSNPFGGAMGKVLSLSSSAIDRSNPDWGLGWLNELDSWIT